MMKRDPIELTPEFQSAEPKVDELLRKLVLKTGNRSSRNYWNLKKQMLLRDYGIRWKSPAEMNPEMTFD